MLTVLDEPAERISTAHRAKLAYVYIRQSTAVQVRQHQESTQLQYRLVERATSLGWPRERVTVIDDDLGKSGSSSTERYGFQRLIADDERDALPLAALLALAMTGFTAILTETLPAGLLPLMAHGLASPKRWPGKALQPTRWAR